MQRSSTSLQKSCLLSECLRRPSVCRLSPRRAIICSTKSGLRDFSTVIPCPTRLPVLDFLHPRSVRSAVQAQRRLDRQIRRYASGSDDDGLPPSTPGWSQSELERQKELEHQRESEEAANKIFEELEIVKPKNESPSLHYTLNDQDSEIVPHITSSFAAMLTDVPVSAMTPNDKLEQSNLTTEEQSSLNALRIILRGFISNRQQQAIEICKNNHLVNYLSYSERREFANYLYKSQDRSQLLQLLEWFPHSQMFVPTLCRLGRLQEAQQAALKELGKTANVRTIFQVLLVLDEYLKRGDWINAISLWQEAVMLPTIGDARRLITPHREYVTLLHCLAKIPNPVKWFITKAAS